ncbi:hypothetical protein, partial [Planotetraspora mira]|uniref:hypothetical protein n=1 Tax=Planotetraspora mira TaxID=58121 RepID=UPI0036712219
KTTNLTSKRNYMKDGVYTPILERGHVVQCEFTGIGEELDYLHYAIVWNTKKTCETINVIPLTSQFKEESVGTFYLNKIENFMTKDKDKFVNKESFVYVNKLMEVSRKRIKPVYKQEVNGTIIKNDKNQKELLKISEEQKERILESIELLYLESNEFLVDKLKSIPIGSQFEEDLVDNSELLDLGYRKIINYNQENTQNHTRINFEIAKKQYSLSFKKMNDHNWKTFKSLEHAKLYTKIKYEKNNISRRNNLIEGIFSRDNLKVEEAKKLLKQLLK